MSEASDTKKEGFAPTKMRWWRCFYFLLFGLMEADWTYRLAKGDWGRIQQAIPAAAAFMAAFAGALFLIGLLVEGVRTRRWMDMSGLRPKGMIGWFEHGFALVLLFLFVLHWALGRSLPAAGGTDWAHVLADSVPNAGDALAFGGALLFFVAISWWLGFIDRDAARAAAKDRTARLT